ncbi:MAG: HlyD family efflux transporter periplasmic adaptor subunit [Bryobacterales bacterium]|nr:HlyD family efflux transporter periplasmic adaptor subunit [Bryobacterales bacterium]
MRFRIRPIAATESAALTAVKAVALLVALSFLLTPLSRGREPRTALTGTRHTALPARINAARTFAAHSPATAHIKSISVKVGDWVKANDIIAILENRDMTAERHRAELRLRIATQALAVLRARPAINQDPSMQELRAAQAQVHAIEQQIESYAIGPLEESYNRAKANLDRVGKLAHQQLATDVELTAARKQEQAEWRNLNAARQTAERLQTELASARKRVEQADKQVVVLGSHPNSDIAELNLTEAEATVRALEERESQLTIRAPGPGRVTQLPKRPGEEVTPGTLIAQIVDLSRLNFDVAVTSKVAQAVEVGSLVEVIVPKDPPVRVDARISEIVLAPEQQQPYIVRVTIDNPSPNEMLVGLEGAVQFQHTRGSWLEQLLAMRRDR